MPSNILTVSQLNRYVKSLFDENRLLSEIFIKGEISNYIRQYKSGHAYFTLKEQSASIKCVMFNGYADAMRFIPDNGMCVIARASVTLYERDGSYQLNVMDMQPDGLGALHLAYEQLKVRLELEGLFRIENKKAIPEYPRKIGVVTSKDGAAIKDIINVLSRRYPLADVLIADVPVQGIEASKRIATAIDDLNSCNACDVIIVGRGGGSLEDLWAFNEEITVRAVYRSNIPVISAVGHETDYTLCDFVSDLRAPTPSAAAELSVPSLTQIRDDLKWYKDRALEGIKNKIEYNQNILDDIKSNKAIKNPMFFVEQNRQKLDFLLQLNNRHITELLIKKQNEINKMALVTDSLSPLKILSRGYSISFDETGSAIKSTEQLKAGELIRTRLHDGEFLAVVSDIMPSSEGEES